MLLIWKMLHSFHPYFLQRFANVVFKHKSYISAKYFYIPLIFFKGSQNFHDKRKSLTDPISSSDDSSAPTPELRLPPRFRNTGEMFLWSTLSECEIDSFIVDSFLFEVAWSLCLLDFCGLAECLYLDSVLSSLFLKFSRPSCENDLACPNPEALLKLVLLPPSKCDKLGRRTPQLKLSTLSP